MKKLFFGVILSVLASAFPAAAAAAVDIHIGIALPPPVLFAAPPMPIVIPETNVYVDPEIEVDLFFWNGWWWRPWEGRWYRSRYHDRGWVHYKSVPSFYFDVDPGWRRYYRDRDWHGHRWDYERIPHQRLQKEWKGWQKNRHWERRGTWGVRDYQPRPVHQRQELRQQRRREYQQSPEIQRQRQQRQEHSQPRGRQRQGDQEGASEQRKDR